VLEQVRLLTNLETNQRKLLQIIMLGQPELKNSCPDLSYDSWRSGLLLVITLDHYRRKRSLPM
jgi:hypothetical protein